MANQPNEITRAVQLRKAAKLAFGVDDQEEGLSRITESLGVQADLWSLPEWAALRHERIYSIWNSTGTAPVGRFPYVQMLNLPGSTNIVVVEALMQSDAGGGPAISTLLDNTSTVILANPVIDFARPLDLRDAASSTQIVHGDGAASLTVPGSVLLKNPGVIYPVPYVLVPGSSLFLAGDVANQGFRFMIVFRERKAFPGEINERA